MLYRSLLLLGLSIVSTGSYGYLMDVKIPKCFDRDEEIWMPNNKEVLEWKARSKEQYHDRGFVVGKIVSAIHLQGIQEDAQENNSLLSTQKEKDHYHFMISIGPDKSDIIEIIYNRSFGEMPKELDSEMRVTVCGDYITDRRTSQAGAIIHWVHYNPQTRPTSKNHEHGFIMIDRYLIGFDQAPKKAWDGILSRELFGYISKLNESLLHY